MALRDGRGIVRALSVCNKNFPALSAVFFRAAIRWKFGSSYDIREVTRYIAAFRDGVPSDYRWLIAPRETEAFIRAEVGKETRLVRDISVDSQPWLSGMQGIMRAIFDEAAASASGRSALAGEVIRASGDHRVAAEASGMRLDSLFAGHALSSGEFESSMAYIDQAFTSAQISWSVDGDPEDGAEHSE